jgi:hypothetical protein
MTDYQDNELIISGTRRGNITMGVASACAGAAIFFYMKAVQAMTIQDINKLLKELYDVKPKNLEGL